jgi:hypothetical protein
MLLARLVTGRYGYLPGDERPPMTAAPANRNWLARLVSAVFPKKSAG